MISTNKANPLDRIFGRLLTATNTKPYGLPVFKTFLAPQESEKFDAFFATLQTNGWDVDSALAAYKDEELTSTVAFYDALLDEYKFCITELFWRLNGYHVTFSNDRM